jgi:electron transfer flavoprotein beta subunit
MKAKQKEVKAINLAALGLPGDQVGAAGSKTKINRYLPPPSRPPGKIVSGEILEAAQKLVKLLREEAKVV